MKLLVFLTTLLFPAACFAEGALLFSYEFSTGSPLADSTGNFPDLKIEAPATPISDGKDGGGLAIVPPVTLDEKKNFVEIPANALKELPTDSLTIEFDFKPDEEFFTSNSRLAFLLDQQYTASTGIQITFDVKKKILTAQVGNGEHLLTTTSEPLAWLPLEWVHIKMSYHAQTGALRLLVNGVEVASKVDNSFGALNFGDRAMRLGNRLALYYRSAPGIYDNFQASGKKASD